VIGETTALGLSALMAIAHLFAGVSLPANHGIRPIESIIAGDLVWAMDPDTGEEDWRQVLETFVHPDAVLELAIEDGTSTEVLTVTGGHPFWERERGWTPAGELLPGDEVFTSRGGWARIGGGTWIAGEQLVYNFEVEGAHTYFVGETGAWVHNACFTPDQAALHALAREANRTGVRRAEAAALLRWGRETRLPVAGHTRTVHWNPGPGSPRPPGAPATGPLPHIRVGNFRHIWVRP